VRALLADADLLVLPSYAEGQAMSVLEAMAAGRCVICTPVGALAEAVEPDRSGLIVPPGDVEALAGALERCLNAPELRASLGVAARRRFEEAFDVRRYPERLRPVYARAAIRA
jgi:glycosyltransferase involved in cell wall biosynthesis